MAAFFLPVSTGNRIMPTAPNRGRILNLALFDLAVDSKLRACDLSTLRVRDVAHGEHVSSRAIVMQQKTQRHVLDAFTLRHPCEDVYKLEI